LLYYYPVSKLKASTAVSYSTLALSFAYFVLFNLFDLSSTILALRLGLSEGNFILVYLASRLGIGIADGMMLVKSVFFVGVGGLFLLGVLTRNQAMKKVVLSTMIVFVVIFALVSMSNFITIYSALSTAQ
jgi:hypothetical protein